MIGCLRTRVRKQPIIALYFESDTVLKFYNLEARCFQPQVTGLIGKSSLPVPIFNKITLMMIIAARFCRLPLVCVIVSVLVMPDILGII